MKEKETTGSHLQQLQFSVPYLKRKKIGSTEELLKRNNGQARKTPIWEIFEDMRIELVEAKRSIKKEVNQALAEKEFMESQLERISFTPRTVQLWRFLQSNVKRLASENKDLQKRRMFGDSVFEEYNDSDETKFEKLSKLTIKLSEERKRKKCMIYSDSSFKQVWGYFLVFLLAYTVIIVPLSLSVIDFDVFPTFKYIDFIVNAVFFLDIFICLFTAIEDDEDNRCQIFLTYAKSWLLFDIISIIPFDLFLSDDKAAGIKLLTRIPRFMRLARIFKLLKVGGRLKKKGIFRKLGEYFDNNPTATKLLQFFITMVVVIHITGCLWLFIAKLDDYGPNTWIYE